MNRTNLLTVTSLVLLLAVCAKYCGVGSTKQNAREQRAEATKRTADLVRSFNASRSWASSLPPWPFPSDLKRALIRSDSRPVLITGRVKDIYGEADSPVLVVKHESPSSVGLELVVALRSTPQQVTRIRDAYDGYIQPTVAVIAQIDSLVPAESARNELFLDEYAKHVAYGTCLGLDFIGIGGQFLVHPEQQEE